VIPGSGCPRVWRVFHGRIVPFTSTRWIGSETSDSRGLLNGNKYDEAVAQSCHDLEAGHAASWHGLEGRHKTSSCHVTSIIISESTCPPPKPLYSRHPIINAVPKSPKTPKLPGMSLSPLCPHSKLHQHPLRNSKPTIPPSCLARPFPTSVYDVKGRHFMTCLTLRNPIPSHATPG